MFDDYKLYEIRPSTILTNSPVAGNILGDSITSNLIYEKNQLILAIDFTLGDLTSADIIIEYSQDGTNYYQETLQSIDYTTGVITEVPAVHTLTGDAAVYIATPIKWRYVRVTSTGTGTVTGSLLAINAMIGVVQ